MTRRLGSTLAGAALACLVGAATGFVLTFVHRQFPLPISGAELPLGLIGGLAIVTALLAGFRLAFDDRWPAGGAAVGIVAASSVLALPGAGGSLLVIGDAVGYVWAFGPALIALVVLGWPRPRRVVTGDRPPS